MHREVDLHGKVPPDVQPDELKTWILFENLDLLVINKPGWLVCHPSKRGPLSSLIGAARLHTGADTLHLVARLDRETSGVVVLAKNRVAARKYQMAIEHRRVRKTYVAVLQGELTSAARVDQPIGKCTNSAVYSKMGALDTGDRKNAVSIFTPLDSRNGYTICSVEIETGRRHQIRVHAQWLGHSIVGDKLYGPDENLFLEFIEHGWTKLHDAALPIERQALHCFRYAFDFEGEGEAKEYIAPVPNDMRDLCREKMETELVEFEFQIKS
ncbi:RluA family pseudouridine synthase [Planctomycetota bacterium]